MSHTIYFKSSEKMLNVKTSSIQTIVTSPPYWDLKNYKHSNQIGYNESYELYLERMNVVWKECFRVLKKDGSIFININYRRFNNSIFRIHDDFIKQLAKIGFIFQEKLIWHKPSGIPTALPRLADRYEYILHFSKSETFFINDDFKFNDYKNNLVDNTYNSWRIIKKAGSIGKQFEHPAIYPVELAQRAIELTSKIDDYVLDPFLGSGSTTIAAISSNRKSICFELNTNYKQLIQYRLDKEVKNKFELNFI